MPADTTTPLATSADMRSGGFADFVRSYSDTALDSLMMEATRACEGIAARRLAPFTGLTESQRAEGVDPDEYTDGGNLPLDLSGTLGRSYAAALGASSLVRHVWLNEYAPRYPEFWSYSDLSIIVVRSYGGTQPVTPGQIISQDPDTGHIFFQLGLFLPVGSDIKITYSGGYQTIPADLTRAAKFMAASLAATEIDPYRKTKGANAAELRAEAEAILTDGYART